MWMVKRGHQNDTKQYRYYKEVLNCPKVIPWLLILSTEGSDKSMESIFYSRTAQGVFESKIHELGRAHSFLSSGVEVWRKES